MSAAPELTPLEVVLGKLHKVKELSTGNYIAQCVGHDDDRPSLSVKVNKDGSVLLHCFAGCATETVVAKLGLEMSDLFIELPEPTLLVNGIPFKKQNPKGRIVATYDYLNADRTLAHQTVRKEPKQFLQRRPDGAGGWIWDLKDIEPVVFGLPELCAAPGARAVVFEGEKDVLCGRTIGLLGTTNPMGAGKGKWKASYSKQIGPRPMVVVGDNDQAGRDHALAVAASLTDHGCEVRIVSLPGLEEKGDFSDWMNAGGTRAAFEKLVDAAAVFEPFGASESNEPEETTTEPVWSPPIPLSDVGVLPTYEAERLGPALGDMALSLADSLQMPTDLPAMLVVRTLSAAVAGKIEVRIKEDWSEGLNDYSVGVIDSGTRKTPAYKAATRPFYDREAIDLEAYAKEKPKIEAKRSILEKTIKRLEDTAAKGTEDSAQAGREAEGKREELEATILKPPPRRVVSDITPEKMGQMLEDNNERLAVFSPEGEFFGQIAGRYSDNSPRLEIFLAAYSSDPVRVDRVNRPPNIIRRPVLTIAIVAQPGSIAGLGQTQGIRDRGGIARFEYYLPVSFVGYRDTMAPSLSSASRQMYEDLIEAGMALPEPNTVDAKGRVKPYQIHLCHDAQKRFQAFMQTVEHRLREGEDLAEMRDWGSKYCGRVARLAGVLHCANILSADSLAKPWKYELTRETLDHAISIGDGYLVPHAHAAYNLMAASPSIGPAQKVLRRILERFTGSTFTRRDLHQSVRKSMSSDDLDKPLALLEQHGYIRALNPMKQKGPGRPTDLYEINPLGRTQNPLNPQKEKTADYRESTPGTQNPQYPQNHTTEEGEL